MIYTIGYQALPSVQSLVELAKDKKACLVDIRMSGRARGWHETTIRNTCETLGVGWARMVGLGNRNYREASAPIMLDNPEPAFTILVNDYLDQGRSIMLMCACRSFVECHRTTVATELARRTKHKVEHVQPTPTTTKHQREAGLFR